MPLLARRTFKEPRLKEPRFADPWDSSAGTGERAFAFAKACGLIGKSFIGKRISELGKLHSVDELYRLLFPDVSRELPSRELLVDLESRILQRTTRHILAIINCYASPPELLVRQLRSCEYADLKNCLHYISSGKPRPPLLSDIGRFKTVHFKAYPDIAAMVAGTEFDFIREKDLHAMKSPDFDFVPLEAELDLRYYRLLSKSLGRLSADDRLFAQQILADEISLRNCVWALRLRTYFKKKPDEAAKYIMDKKMARAFSVIPGLIHPRITDPDMEISLATEAYAMLNLPLDMRQAWKTWRWESLLNPEVPGKAWVADPRYFQNAASRYIYRLSRRCFKLMPFSISASFCYIKLKQFEEDILTSITEGLGLGMSSKDVFDLLEVPS